MEAIDINNFDIEKEIEKIRKENLKPNILVCGATGVGKSTLINHVFGSELARVGTGIPVTRGIQEYKSDESPVVLFDSEGYEVGNIAQSHFKENVIGFIDIKKQNEDIAQNIHLVWYCISAGNKRITDLDIETINELSKKDVKVAVIYSQIDSVSQEELNSMIEQHNRSCTKVPYFKVSIDENVPLEYLDWDRLIGWSIENLDDVFKTDFIKSLKTDLDKKKEMVNKKIIPKYATMAAGVAVTPIPTSDSFLIIPVQVKMTLNIMEIFNLDNLSNNTKAIINSSIISTAGKTVAKMLLTNLIKFFPGIGTFAGVAINATVASSFTMALGYSISELSYRYSKAVINGENIDILDIFNNEIISMLFEEYFKNLKGAKK